MLRTVSKILEKGSSVLLLPTTNNICISFCLKMSKRIYSIFGKKVFLKFEKNLKGCKHYLQPSIIVARVQILFVSIR